MTSLVRSILDPSTKNNLASPKDTGPLRTFAQSARDRITQRTRPSPCQRSDLSELQRFVKQARRSIVDPILARFADVSSPEPESEEEIDPIELRRRQEQENIRELKKRQIRPCGLSLPLGTKAVIIRPEVDDEAMDVDVSIDDNEDIIIPLDNMEAVPSSPVKPKPAKAVRRPPKKTANEMLDDDGLSACVPVPEKVRLPKNIKVKPPPRSAIASDVESEVEKPKKARGAAKPKPETYKQAWSESEQNLLEQLLEQIPDGERFRYVVSLPKVTYLITGFRWQKISRAMGGRRTPRQVASRVQKYFEKLKRFGVDS